MNLITTVSDFDRRQPIFFAFKDASAPRSAPPPAEPAQHHQRKHRYHNLRERIAPSRIQRLDRQRPHDAGQNLVFEWCHPRGFAPEWIDYVGHAGVVAASEVATCLYRAPSRQ